MLKRLLLASLLSWLALVAPALAGIAYISGADINGSIAFANAGSGANSLVATLPSGSSLPAGNLGVILIPMRTANTPTGCIDSKGNSWSLYPTGGVVSNGVTALRALYSNIGTSLVAGDTLTCNFNSTSASKSIILLGFSGQNATPLDAASTTANAASGTTYTATTGTPTCTGGGAGCGVAIGIETPANGGTITPDAGFTVVGVFTGVNAYVQYKLISAASAVTWSVSSSGSSGAWSLLLPVFNAAAGGGGATNGASMMGMIP